MQSIIKEILQLLEQLDESQLSLLVNYIKARFDVK